MEVPIDSVYDEPPEAGTIVCDIENFLLLSESFLLIIFLYFSIFFWILCLPTHKALFLLRNMLFCLCVCFLVVLFP